MTTSAALGRTTHLARASTARLRCSASASGRNGGDTGDDDGDDDGVPAQQEKTYRTAALCSDVWQNRKRTSLRLLVKAYLLDMTGGRAGGRASGFQSRVCVRTVCPGAVEVGGFAVLAAATLAVVVMAGPGKLVN